jgi:hypothetical protein
MKTHSSRLFDKLGTKRRTQAVPIGKTCRLIMTRPPESMIFRSSHAKSLKSVTTFRGILARFSITRHHVQA